MKKIISTLLSGILVVMVCIVPSYSYPNHIYNKDNYLANVAVRNMSKTITQENIKEIVKSTIGCISDDDGNILTSYSTITIEDYQPLNTYVYNSNNLNKTYKVTVDISTKDKSQSKNSRKIVSDNKDVNKRGAVASATLQLIWTDGKGYDNTIDEVSGEVTIEKGTLNYSFFRYGDGLESSLNWTKQSLGSKTSFSCSPNIVVKDPSAEYIIGIDPTDNTRMIKISIRVSANILQ